MKWTVARVSPQLQELVATGARKPGRCVFASMAGGGKADPASVGLQSDTAVFRHQST